MIHKITMIILILTCSSLMSAQDYIDKNPSQLVQSDIEFLRDFEQDVYNLSLHVRHYDEAIIKVIGFIRTYSIYNDIYDTNWKIDFRAKTGLINGKTSEETENHREEVGLVFTYPILDSKEKKERLEKKLKRNTSLIDDVKLYFEAIKEISSLETEEKYYRMVELRSKVREKKGIIHLDERLETIKKLIDNKAKIEGLKIKKLELKEKILVLVPEHKQDELEQLLKI